jgi:type I site-specific restriction endonuclease
VYEYLLAQGIEDGYLAPCEIKQGRVTIDGASLVKTEVIDHKAKRVDTGERAKDGRLAPVAYEDYKRELAQRLTHEAASLAEFRQRWIAPMERQSLMDALVTAHRSPRVIQLVDAKQDFDLFDVLAELGYRAKPRTRIDRSLAFRFKNEAWLDAMPPLARGVILGMAGQVERLASGAVHKTIYMPTIQSFHVCAPEIADQRRIARILRDRLAAAEALTTALKARLADIERLPQRLLAAAFGQA